MFSRRPFEVVVLPNSILADLRKYRSAQLPNETGGFLLGHRREGSIEVVSYTSEQTGDHATPTSFIRASPAHEKEIKAQWKATEGQLSAVGDWHSHPWGDGSPSSTDRRAWKTLIRAWDRPIFALILGEQDAYGAFYVIASRIRPSVRRLTILQDDGCDTVFGFATTR